MRKTVLTNNERLEIAKKKKQDLLEAAKRADAIIKSIEAKARHDNRKAEDAVKYAIGGLVLKLYKEETGGLYKWILNSDGKKTGSMIQIDELVPMLPEAQQEKAKTLLEKPPQEG